MSGGIHTSFSFPSGANSYLMIAASIPVDFLKVGSAGLAEYPGPSWPAPFHSKDFSL